MPGFVCKGNPILTYHQITHELKNWLTGQIHVDLQQNYNTCEVQICHCIDQTFQNIYFSKL